MQQWTSEWGYQALFTCCASNKAGVGILFNKKITFQILKTYIDPLGRFLICDIRTNDIYLTIANLYAPNDDNKSFFTNVFDHLRDFKGDDVTIGGDFVLDLEKDKKGGFAKTHKQSASVVHDALTEFDLVDIWTTFNPDGRRYTWRQKLLKFIVDSILFWSDRVSLR